MPSSPWWYMPFYNHGLCMHVHEAFCFEAHVSTKYLSVQVCAFYFLFLSVILWRTINLVDSWQFKCCVTIDLSIRSTLRSPGVSKSLPFLCKLFPGSPLSLYSYALTVCTVFIVYQPFHQRNKIKNTFFLSHQPMKIPTRAPTPWWCPFPGDMFPWQPH